MHFLSARINNSSCKSFHGLHTAQQSASTHACTQHTSVSDETMEQLAAEEDDAISYCSDTGKRLFPLLGAQGCFIKSKSFRALTFKAGVLEVPK